LSGRIPTGIGNFLIIRHLYLNNNQFSGEIPFSIGKLTSVNSLDLSHNELSGSLPSSIGNIGSEAGKPIKLYLSGNNLSGSIPNSIANLPSGSRLNLSYNQFTFDGMELVAQKFPDAEYSPQKNILIHQNSNILSVSAGGTLSNNTYKWFKCEGPGTAPIHVATIKGDSTFHPSASGGYRVKVLNSVATQLQLYSKIFDYTAPKNAVIASNENALQQNDNINLFRVYPNPVKNIFHVQINGGASFSLLNQAGKILLTKSINGNGEINVANLAAGLYYLRNNATGAVHKVIVAK